MRTKFAENVDYGSELLNRRVGSFPVNIQLFFQNLKRNQLTQKTMLSYAKNLDSMRSRLGKKNLLKVTQADFDQFTLNPPKDIKRSSMAAFISTLRELYKFAEEEGFIERSPIKKTYKVTSTRSQVDCYLRFRHYETIRKVLTSRTEHVQNSTTSLKKYMKELRRSLAIRLILDTGCRTEELLEIFVGDIKEEKVELSGKLVEVPFCKINNAKVSDGADEERKLRIRRDTYEIFVEYVRLASATVKRGSTPLIDVSEKTIRNWIYDLQKDLVSEGLTELEKLAAHDIRRSFFTQVDATISSVAAKKYLMGHKRDQTESYAVFTTDKIAQLCEEAFGYE